jgi:hypothetical protein
MRKQNLHISLKSIKRAIIILIPIIMMFSGCSMNNAPAPPPTKSGLQVGEVFFMTQTPTDSLSQPLPINAPLQLTHDSVGRLGVNVSGIYAAEVFTTSTYAFPFDEYASLPANSDGQIYVPSLVVLEPAEIGSGYTGVGDGWVTLPYISHTVAIDTLDMDLALPPAHIHVVGQATYTGDSMITVGGTGYLSHEINLKRTITASGQYGTIVKNESITYWYSSDLQFFTKIRHIITGPDYSGEVPNFDYVLDLESVSQ